MIRRDYLLRMVEQAVQALARILAYSREGKLERARTELDEAIRTLAGKDAREISSMSEMELLAALLTGEPTQVLRQKAMLLSALLHQAGDLFAAEGAVEESRAAYLKALNLQLHFLAQEGSFEIPECVPRIDVLVQSLASGPLPLSTRANLMQHYERLGRFSKAEDALFDMLDSEPTERGLVEFGIQFYHRLLRQDDASLEAGDLPRHEVEAGLAELKAKGS